MNKLDKDYKALLQDIIDNGHSKNDRTGTGTISVFGRQIRHSMSSGFPLLTTKKMYFKGIVTELLWFLRGDTNIKYLVDNDCHIWDGDCYQNYCKHTSSNSSEWNQWMKQNQDGSLSMYTKQEFVEKIKNDDNFAKEWAELGQVYGAQWRSWYTKTLIKTNFKDPISGEDTYVEGDKWIDQIADLINTLRTNPDSRRMLVTAWNPADLDSCVLPPCHYGFQVYTRELSLEERLNLISGEEHNNTIVSYCENPSDTFLKKLIDAILSQQNIPTRAISLQWNQRSCDFGLGAPFNIASYGLLLEIIAKEVNMVPDELIGNFGDTHLYLDHIEPIKQQLNRESYPLPKLNIMYHSDQDPSIIEKTLYWKPEDFKVEDYQSHPTIKLPLSN